MESSLQYYILHYGPQLCLSWVDPTRFSHLTGALICGVDPHPGFEREVFVRTGLIHILVVSGAHLGFFERCLWFLPATWRTAFLGGYCWLTGFGAPIVRSFARHLVDGPLRRRGCTLAQREALASVGVLLLVPWWLDSRSFLMSWMCAQALSLPSKRPSVWWSSFFVFLFLYAFCLASPLTIVLNALLAPVIGAAVFPVGLLSLIIPYVSYVADFLWALLLEILGAFEIDRPTLFIETKWLMVLPWVSQILVLVWEVRWRRRFSFSSR